MISYHELLYSIQFPLQPLNFDARVYACMQGVQVQFVVITLTATTVDHARQIVDATAIRDSLD